MEYKKYMSYWQYLLDDGPLTLRLPRILLVFGAGGSYLAKAMWLDAAVVIAACLAFTYWRYKKDTSPQQPT